VVASRGTFPTPDGTAARVDLIDTRTLQVTPVFVEGATTTGHQWLSPDGRYTYVAWSSTGRPATGSGRAGRSRGWHVSRPPRATSRRPRSCWS
jgi:hypothetical protein